MNPIEGLAKFLIGVGNLLTPGKPFGAGRVFNEKEMREFLELAQKRGLVDANQQEMINSVFELGDTLARELMVPRTEMVWIERDKTLRQALSLALRSGYSRIPVAGENLDDIIGIAYIKDLAKRSHDHREAAPIEKAMKEMCWSSSFSRALLIKSSTSIASRSANVSIGVLVPFEFAWEIKKATRGSCSCR